MKSKHFFGGILFISIGILWILKSLGVISFSWCLFVKLWPLIFIWIGIKMIPMPDKWKIFLNTTVLLIGISFLLIVSNSKCCDHRWSKSYSCSKDWKYSWNEDEEAMDCSSENFVKYEDTFEIANLKLSATAGKLAFATGKELISIQEMKNPRSKINIRTTIDDNTVNIKAEVRPFKNNISKNSYKYNVLLNSTPVWNMNLELSATSGQIDLSNFKINELAIESNASSLDIKLGNLYDDVNVKIESNASAVKIMIPHNMESLLKKAENNLSSFKVKGLIQESKNRYVSNSDGETVGTVNITIESNVSSVEVIRY